MVDEMSFLFQEKLPAPQEIREQYPLSPEMIKVKKERDQEIQAVITGKSDKVIVIIGPCSADHEDPVCDYISRDRKSVV